MTTHVLAPAALVLALVALTSCGGSGDEDPTPATASSTTDGSPAPSPSPRVGQAAASTPQLLQCLTQDGLLAGGPTEQDLADGVVSERIWVTLSDGSEFAPVTGALHVLSDGAQATAYADALLTTEVDAGEVTAESATVSVHGNVVAVLESDAGDTAFAATMRGCLPGADPATAVRPPAEGAVTLASLMECAATVGMSAYGERSYFDVEEQQSGSVVFRTPNDFGGYDERATVYVFPDADHAEEQEAATIGDEEARLFERHGNAIVRLLDTLDADDPTRETVLGCLPT